MRTLIFQEFLCLREKRLFSLQIQFFNHISSPPSNGHLLGSSLYCNPNRMCPPFCTKLICEIPLLSSLPLLWSRDNSILKFMHLLSFLILLTLPMWQGRGHFFINPLFNHFRHKWTTIRSLPGGIAAKVLRLAANVITGQHRPFPSMHTNGD